MVSAASSRPATRTGASRRAPRRSPRPIASDPKPDVLVVHSPDLNSYSKLFKKAQEKGIYVILIDNPTNFPADAFIGSDWDRLGQLEAEAVDQGLRRRLLEEDRPRSGRPGQRLEPLSICRHHEGAGEASGLQGGRQARFELGRDDRAQCRRPPCCSRTPTSAASSTSGTATPPAPRRRSATPARRASLPGHHRRRRKGRLRQAPVRRVRRSGDDRAAEPVAAT